MKIIANFVLFVGIYLLVTKAEIIWESSLHDNWSNKKYELNWLLILRMYFIDSVVAPLFYC